jgi:hypothetical protein
MSRQRQQRGLNDRLLLVEQIVADTGFTHFMVLGTTGKTYVVKLIQEPECSCPDFCTRGVRCKHIYFVLQRVLGCGERLAFQPEFTPDQLTRMLTGQPAVAKNLVASQDSEHKVIVIDLTQEDKVDGVAQKPITDEDPCPMCYETMDPKTEQIVYCKAKCGQNMHKQCLKRWGDRQLKVLHQKTVSCPMCREPWSKS